MTESEFYKNKVKDKLKAIPNSWWTRIESKVLRGIPDVMGCIGPNMVTLELKKSRKDAEQISGRIVLQKYNVSQITKCGAIAFIVYPENWDDVYEQLLLLTGSDGKA